MKNNRIQFFWSKTTAWFAVITLTFFLSGCLDNDNDSPQPVPLGYVAIYHAAPDAPELDIIVDNKQINSQPFSYTDYSGYLNFYTGNRSLKFKSVSAANTLIDTTFDVEEDKAYSVFVIDRLPNLETLVVIDSAGTPASGKAMVRFVNLSPDAPPVDVVTAAGPALFESTAFKHATAFREVDAKTYSFVIKDSDTGNTLLSADDIDLHDGQYYTIITRGFANPPAGNTNILSVEVL